MEDQEVMDQILENKQGYVFDNINTVAGCGGVGVGEVMGGDDEMMGVKYEEQLLEKNDDDELKYVKEVQQSEKQQLMENEGDLSNSNELAEREKETVEYEVGIKEENMYNQKEFGNEAHNKDNRNGHNEYDGFNQLNQVAEAASQSNTYDCEGHPVALVEQKSKEMEKEEHFSSMMTNTTNGIRHDIQATDEKDAVLHFSTGPVEERTAEPNADQRMNSNDFETTPSQLNPDAKEFVPFSEPNLMSANFLSGAEELNFEEEKNQNDYDEHVPSVFPRRILGEDDFVAHSPRKGRGNDMDTILVPAAQEFEEEADQRPHELEADVLSASKEANLNTDKTQQASLSDLIAVQDGQLDCTTSIINRNGSDLVVHGSTIFANFDADNDIGESSHAKLSQNNELMKQSIYVTSGEGIECVLNSVQPIPTEIDSVNSSFNEELPVSVDSFADKIPACISLGDKESLQVEEKEHISKSPSTEEIQTTMHPTSENVLDEIHLTIVDNFNNHQTVNLTAETRDLDTKHSENEIPNLIQSFDIQSEHYTAYSTPVEEKYLMEQTKELETPIQTTRIDQLMCEMIICDDALRTQDDKKEGESCTMNNVESHINKCEPDMLNVKNPTNNKNEIKDFGTLPSQHATTANDLFQNVQHSSNINTATGSNGSEITSEESLFENATAIVEVVTPTEDISSQLEETLNAKTVPDFVKSEPSEFANRYPRLEDSECQQLLGEVPSCMEEKINEIKTLISEGNIIRDEEAPQQNFIEKSNLSHGEDPRAETTIANQEAVENAFSTVGSAASAEAALPLETRNISAGKKLLANKNSAKALQTKVTSSHQISSKKITIPEAAKKPLSAVTKTKPMAVKTSTTTGSIDRKLSKPSAVTHLTTSTTQSNVRKSAVTTTAAPKIPLKGNISARPTQTTSSTVKATASRPLVSSRGFGLAPTTSRKPVTTVNSSTAKTNPRSVSADPVKPNTLRTSDPGTGKPKAVSPRTTHSSQLRKPGQIATTVKSPVKPTIPTSSTKTTAASMGSRPKSGLTTASNVASVTIKTNTSRAAPKVPSCATTTSRRLAVGGSTGGAVTSNATTKLSTTRKTSPMKLSSGKTPTKVTTSNTKSVITSTSLKPTENILNKQLEIIGDFSSNKTNNSNVTNSILKTVSVTEEYQESIVGNNETEKPRSNDNIAKPEPIALDTEPLQEDLIGANDY